MLIRPFLNSDPPHLVRIWMRQPPQRGLAARIDANVLEAIVFSKQYFDPAGLLIAEEGSRVVGFAHAGFGSNDDGKDLSTELGVTCLILVDPDVDLVEVGGALLQAGEQYLRGRGARVLYGGGIRPLDPFYLGLYGGSELPGILQSDTRQVKLFEHAGYRVVDQCMVLQLNLEEFRPPMDRQQLLLKRSYRVAASYVPTPQHWWAASTLPSQEPTQFEVAASHQDTTCGHVSFWWMDPIARGWGCIAAGLYDLFIHADLRRRGLATLLIAESLKQLRLNGVQLVEAQTMIANTPALGLYKKLGFRDVDRGLVFRRE